MSDFKAFEEIKDEKQDLDEDIITGNTTNVYIVDETIINQNDDEALNYYLKKQERIGKMYIRIIQGESKPCREE